MEKLSDQNVRVDSCNCEHMIEGLETLFKSPNASTTFARYVLMAYLSTKTTTTMTLQTDPNTRQMFPVIDLNWRRTRELLCRRESLP